MSEICLNGSKITAENIFDIAQNGQIPVYGLTRDVGQFKNESLQNKLNHDMEVLADHSTTIGKRVIKNFKI